MKKQYLLLLAIMLLTSILSCKRDQSVEISAPNLVFQYLENPSISEIITDIEYIRLETNDSCLIGYIGQVLCYGDKYYMLDQIAKSIYVFSDQGQYIGKISRTGQGPGEYIILYSIAIDEVGNMLYINDVAQKKILTFDVNTLQFVSDYSTGIEAEYLCILNNSNNIVWYNCLGIGYNGKLLTNHIMTSNLNYSSLKEFIPVEFSTGYVLRPVSPFFQTDESVIFSHPYKGVVYEILSGETNALFTFNFQKHTFPTFNYLRRLESKGNFANEVRQSEYINYFNTFSNDNSYCINFYADRTFFMAVHNKTTAQNIYFPVKVLKDNISENVITDDMGILIFNNPTFCDGNYYYSLINPNSILDKQKKYTEQIHPQLLQIINEIGESDNPILLKYKLK